VEDLVATPSDPQVETVYARIRVAAGPSELHLASVGGQGQIAVPGVPMPSPVVLRVTDADNLPYADLRVAASVSSGGSVVPAWATSDEDGLVRFQWTPGPGPLHELTASLDGAPPASAIVVAGLAPPHFEAAGVVNAASLADGLSPGSMATINGFSLSAGVTALAALPYPTMLDGVSVLVNGQSAQLQYISERQIYFVMPTGAQPGPASLVVSTPVGASPPVSLTMLAASPGIFFDAATGHGAVIRDGEYLEIYCTGLGTRLPVNVYLGGFELAPASSGPISDSPGLDQVRVKIPAALSGEQPLSIEVDGRRSNQVKVLL
jgi:uncharacterized protein (TIGR03437 family)